MAWRSSGSSNSQLIANLKAHGIIQCPKVEAAMLRVDRADFCASTPYEDAPQAIGYQATISAPHMHAYVLEILSPKITPGVKVLDVGSGSGYLTACLGIMVGATGRAIGLEHVKQLVDYSLKSVSKNHSDLLSTGQVQIVGGDGRLGCSKEAPFMAIHVGAAAKSIPEELIQQLSPGGRLVIPVGKPNGDQYLEQVDKSLNGEVHKQRLMGVRYVPLTDLKKQC